MHAHLVTLVLAGGIAMVAWPGPIAAQPAETPADTLFRQGRDLMAARKYAEACAAFDASQKLKPDLGTLLNQAHCREQNGQLATAWSLFDDAERQTRQATDLPTRELHRTSVDRAFRLEARISMLTVDVPDEHRVDGLQILRNGEPVGRDAWSKAVPVDGGTYRITARAPARSDWSGTITIGVERDARTIEVPRLAPTAPAPAPVRPRATPVEPAPAAPHRWILPLSFAGGAVGFLGGAAGFAHWAGHTYASARDSTDAATQTSLWHSANQKRYLAGAMLGAGIGCAGVAVWLWLRKRPASAPAAAARNREVAAAPLIDADRVGMSLGGRW